MEKKYLEERWVVCKGELLEGILSVLLVGKDYFWLSFEKSVSESLKDSGLVLVRKNGFLVWTGSGEENVEMEAGELFGVCVAGVLSA